MIARIGEFWVVEMNLYEVCAIGYCPVKRLNGLVSFCGAVPSLTRAAIANQEGKSHPDTSNTDFFNVSLGFAEICCHTSRVWQYAYHSIPQPRTRGSQGTDAVDAPKLVISVKSSSSWPEYILFGRALKRKVTFLVKKLVDEGFEIRIAASFGPSRR